MVWSMNSSFLRPLVFSVSALISGVVFSGMEEDFQTGKERFFSTGDVVGSMEPLKKAADAGHPGAQWLYGYLLDISELDEEAVAYYKKSALQGSVEGQYAYGMAVYSGEGIQKDGKEGWSWIVKAAEAGNRDAIKTLAEIVLKNPEIAQNEEGLRWLNKAVEIDHLPAIEGLASAYRDGKLGLAINLPKSEELMKKLLILKGVNLDGKKKKGAKK